MLDALESSTVTITSDDESDGPSPVNDQSFDSEFFVRRHYCDFRNREPDEAGLQFRKAQLDECEQRPEDERQGCREAKRINVSAAFFFSIEFQETGYFTYLIHQAAFNTGERHGLRDFLADARQIGAGVADAFVSHPGFTSKFSQSLTAGQYVDALNASTGNSLSQAERDDLAGKLNSGALSRGQVLRAVAENPAFHRREFNRAFVLMDYFGYLRRTPDEAPDSSYDGFNFRLAKLDRFGGNFVQAEMVKAFISSDEVPATLRTLKPKRRPGSRRVLKAEGRSKIFDRPSAFMLQRFYLGCSNVSI